MEKRAIKETPCDKAFLVNGLQEMCRSTGYEVRFDNDSKWWGEYIDSEGKFHYVR